MHTEAEQKILEHTIVKVRDLFAEYPAKGHNFDHAEATANWAKKIAIEEKARSVFLCELAGYLHDIGRAAENHDLGYTVTSSDQGHHELSYRMLKNWFQNDSTLATLDHEQKIELLYAIRNHWNNAADKYDTAWILRDADKLDMYGEHGLERQLDAHGSGFHDLNRSLRSVYDCYYWIRTPTARDIVIQNNLMAPINDYYREFLTKYIKEVDE